MTYHHAIIISGQSPLGLAAFTDSEESARACSDHLAEMFPHLREHLVTVAATDWRVRESMPQGGFVRDCLTAYVTTGNGRKKPAPGAVTLP